MKFSAAAFAAGAFAVANAQASYQSSAPAVPTPYEASTTTGNPTTSEYLSTPVVTSTGNPTTNEYLSTPVISSTGNPTTSEYLSTPVISSTGNPTTSEYLSTPVISSTGNPTTSEYLSTPVISSTGNPTTSEYLSTPVISSTGNPTTSEYLSTPVISGTSTCSSGTTTMIWRSSTSVYTWGPSGTGPATWTSTPTATLPPYVAGAAENAGSVVLAGAAVVVAAFL